MALPDTYRTPFGRLNVRRGRLTKPDGALMSLNSWDVIPFCTDSECPAFKLCDLNPNQKPLPKGDEARCAVMIQYLRATADMIFKNFSEYMEEHELFKVGMHLMPLYRMLARLNLEEAGLRRSVGVTDRGTRKADPVYKEIRETIKSIDLQWKALGLNRIVTDRGVMLPMQAMQFRPMKPATGKPRDQTNKDGDLLESLGDGQNYYDQLEAEAHEIEADRDDDQTPDDDATQTDKVSKPTLKLRGK